MSLYSREAENLLGQECITKLRDHVIGGKLSDNQMKYFVQHLGELSEIDPNVLFGNHTRRMDRDKTGSRTQDTELLEVMSDWWTAGLCEMTPNKAMDILVRALSKPEVNGKDLARDLSPAAPAPSQVWHHHDCELFF